MSMTKVLIISLFHPELFRGGAQQVAYELFKELQETPGIEPVLLSSVESTTKALMKSGARITGFDRRRNEFLYLVRDYDSWWHKTGNLLSVESFMEFLEIMQPDVVHFHHFHTFGIDFLSITRSVLPDARIVFTFHEFMAICAANGQMLRLTDHSLCTKASGVRCNQCLPEHSPEQFFIRELWMKKHLGVVDAFTVPSRFMINHYVDWGIDPDKLFHVTNGQADHGAAQRAKIENREKRNRFGFFGQLVDNKGVHVIIDAVSILREQGFTDFTVEINGANLAFATEPRRKHLQTFLAAESQRPIASQIVTMNGSYQVDQLADRMMQIDWCLVPSTWWEIFGLVISEAWMFGKPVICSNIGGPAERVRHEHDGLHFPMGDAHALAATIRRASEEPDLWDRLRANLPLPPARRQMANGFIEIYGRQKVSKSRSNVIKYSKTYEKKSVHPEL